jgi:hypothetical protein
MKIRIKPFDDFDHVLSRARCPYDLFGENPPKTYKEVLEMLKALRELSKKTKVKDMLTQMAFEKMEIFLEWTRDLTLLPSLLDEDSNYNSRREYRLKLAIRVVEFEQRKVFRLDFDSKTIFFSRFSAEAFLGLWWHDNFEVIRGGKICRVGHVRHVGGMSDCNIFTNIETGVGDFIFKADNFEFEDVINFYTIKYNNALDFLRMVS